MNELTYKELFEITCLLAEKIVDLEKKLSKDTPTDMELYDRKNDIKKIEYYTELFNKIEYILKRLEKEQKKNKRMNVPYAQEDFLDMIKSIDSQKRYDFTRGYLSAFYEIRALTNDEYEHYKEMLKQAAAEKNILL